MCGAEFERVINEMIKDGSCPYCENKKVLVGYNDLKTTHPNIAKEWGIENYLQRVYWNVLNAILDIKRPIEDRVIKEKRGHEPCWKCSGRMINILKF